MTKLSKELETCEHTSCPQCGYGQNKVFCSKHQHKRSILEQIIEASKGGYAAEIKTRGLKGLVISLREPMQHKRELGEPEYITVRWSDGDIGTAEPEGRHKFEITGYTFVGNLFGEPKIKEGMKFRVKETGEIWMYKETLDYGMGLLMEKKDGYQDHFQMVEVEPVFE